MEQEEFDRNIACGEILKFDESQICRLTTVFPKKIDNTTSEDICNMSMMRAADINGIVLVRGYTITEQLK